MYLQEDNFLLQKTKNLEHSELHLVEPVDVDTSQWGQPL